MVLAKLRDWVKRIRAFADPKPQTLEEWAHRHARIVGETLDTVQDWIPREGVILGRGSQCRSVHRGTRPSAAQGPISTAFEPVGDYHALAQERLQGPSPGDPMALWPCPTKTRSGQFTRPSTTPVRTRCSPRSCSIAARTPWCNRTRWWRRNPFGVCAFPIGRRSQGLTQVAFIKIDTEGFDYAVLRGMHDFLAKTPSLPPILTELLSRDYHPKWDEQEAILQGPVQPWLTAPLIWTIWPR